MSNFQGQFSVAGLLIERWLRGAPAPPIGGRAQVQGDRKRVFLTLKRVAAYVIQDSIEG
jgi:hypothetical protein